MPVHDIPKNIRALVAEIAAQRDGHRENYTQNILTELHKADLIPENPRWYFPQQGEVFPSDWLAFEVGLFDNGAEVASRDNRDRIRTSQTRFAATIKFHCGQASSFDPRRRPSHEFGVSFFAARDAEIALNLISKKIGCGGRRLTGMAADMIQKHGGDLVGVLRVKRKGKLAHYLRDYIVGLRIDNEVPSAMVVFQRGTTGDIVSVVGGEFTDSYAGGRPLPAKVAGVMRVAARKGELIDWVS